jgi:hypothetical protein
MVSSFLINGMNSSGLKLFAAFPHQVVTQLYHDCQLHLGSPARLALDRASSADFFQPTGEVVQTVAG